MGRLKDPSIPAMRNLNAKFLLLNSLPSYFIVIVSFLLLPALSFSQVNFVNNGAPISNTNLIFVINGNVIHQNNGSIANSGNFYIRGNWTNNNSSDNIFTVGPNGWVHLDSGVQTIGGSLLTHFNNLELAGTGTKQLIGVDAEIEDTLALNDHEFDAGDNTVLVLATDTAIITRTSGFVSSTNDGGLSRNTLSKSPYFFPVGSSVGTARFRPVDITPNEISANTFKVRMANVDPASEGFDPTLKEATVGDINPDFFHKINRTSGVDKADVTIYYNDTADGTADYDILAYWETLSTEWKNPGLAATTSKYGLSGLTKASFENFTSDPALIPFALAVNVELSTNVFVANVFSPNGDGNNDVLHILGKGITEIQFIIYNRWGEKVFETTDIATGWDGTYKGSPLNIGVFVYYIKGKLKDGEEITKKGNVTLLR
ncbi:MAG: gliding motility-associated C-terminal domain-containing protein [Bacteroidota bacterium]